MDDLAIKTRTGARMTFVDFAAFYDTRPQREKWELIDGEAIAIAPSSRTHERIAGNIGWMLNNRLTLARPQWCADRRIGLRVPEGVDWAPVPDVTVAETAIAPGQIYAERFFFVVEVIPSERPDILDRKRCFYTEHAHSRGYMFISHKAVAIELMCREDDRWISTILNDPNAVIDLPSIGVIGKLNEVYRNTELEPK